MHTLVFFGLGKRHVELLRCQNVCIQLDCLSFSRLEYSVLSLDLNKCNCSLPKGRTSVSINVAVLCNCAPVWEQLAYIQQQGHKAAVGLS